MRKKEKYKLIFEKDSADSTVLHWAVYAAAEDFILYLFNLDIFDSEQDKLDFTGPTNFSPLIKYFHLCKD